ncbi:MAG TPA: hydrophobic protein [Spirochaetota bacterium]|nr:hydrophobic protein [Spirochaetota bacterium]HPJ38419.1 hydrophobic protein [Spirochaetota bacterium]HPQ55098.1 hydrophobic protein [Spirochaetota bacterium]
MDNSWKGVVYILGIIAAVYLLIKYVLPLFIVGLGFVLKVVMWVALLFLCVVLVGYIFKMIKNQ